MILRISIYILFSTFVINVRAQSSDFNCSMHQVYSECGANGCQNTCISPTLSFVCRAICIEGCVCEEGYLRNAQSLCVRPEDCDADGCGGDPNAVFNACGEVCPKTCNNKDKTLICPAFCKTDGGCVCKEGFVRDHNWKCIEESECPECGENEFFACGSACDTTCATLGEVCPIVNIKCNEMCYCVDGYARDANNKCIPIKQCPPKKCPRNEMWVPCPLPCPPEQDCKFYLSGMAYSCPIPPNDDVRVCKPECRCNNGYIRKSLPGGTCLKPSQCCDDPNAEVVDCPNPCPGGTCDHPEFAPCKMACRLRGCQCKKGYVKDAAGKCIPKSKCPKKKCGVNEVWNACPRYCSFDKTCEELLFGIIRDCAAPPPNWQCTGRCECKMGFVRIDGECRVPSACCTDPKSELVNCPNPCPGGTCDQPEFSPCKIACRELGCQCKKGYVKDPQGKCIRPSKCPKKCPANEVFVPCAPSCPPEETCPTYLSGIVHSCPPPSKKDYPISDCLPMCRCKDGLIRKCSGGVCIPPNQCCDDPNEEVVDCPNPCPGGTCDQPEFTACDAICPVRGCQCKKGYVKDENGKCILLSKCPKKCEANEVWNPCPRYCTFDKSCGEFLFGYVRDCPPPPPNWQCTGRCECNNGFIRIDGKCLPPSACCTDPNAELVQCPNPCPGGTCDQPNHSPCEMMCKQWGCQCKEGYVKDDQGKCILLSECPAHQCGDNEVWNPCAPYCTFDQTCFMLIDGVVPDCAAPPMDWQCSGRCQCMEGFVRIDDKCVNPSACCTDPNAELVQCPNPCPGGTCDQPDHQPCNLMCKQWGCQCKEGYVKDDQGNCILLEQCPVHECGANEVWVCPQYCTFDNYCSILIDGLLPDCAAPPEFWQCTGQCRCAPGFARVDDKCVHPSACCTDPNSELVSCPNPCPGGTCEQPDFIPCENGCREMGCQCKEGYVKNNLGMCTLLSECTKKCGENEFFDCGSACDRTCATLGDPCNIINKKCVEMCYCSPGYARDNKNVCIPVENCPPRFKCGKNEVYNPCPSPCPPEVTCESMFIGIFPLCPIILHPPVCNPACRCNEGFVRNANGKCVKPEACCTDSNTQLVSNPNCCPGGTCANPVFQECDMRCPKKGCQCKPGYLKINDTNTKCILKRKCPK